MASTSEKAVSQTVRFYRRRWVFVPAIVLLLGALILAGLPYLMSYAMQRWLLDNGAGQVAIGDIDFNPFTGRVAVERLDARSGEGSKLLIPGFSLDIDWLPLFSRQVDIRAVSLEGVEITVEQNERGELRIGGIALPGGEPQATGKPWDYGIDELHITDSSILYRAQDLQLSGEIHTLTLIGLTTWATVPAPLELDGALNGAGVQLNGQLPPLARGVGYSGAIRVTDLPLDAFADVAKASLDTLAGRLSVDSRIEVLQMPDGLIDVAQDGRVQLDDLQLAVTDSALEYKQVQWEGTASLSLPVAGEEIKSKAVGNLTASGLALELPAQGLDVRQKMLSWKGDTAYAGGEKAHLEASGKLQLGGLLVDVSGQEIRLAAVEALETGQLRVQGLEDIAIEELSLKGMSFARDVPAGPEQADPGQAVLSAASLHLDRVGLSGGNRLAIDTMEWRDVTSLIKRDSKGQWQMVRILDTLPFAGGAGDAAGSVQEPVAADKEAPGSVAIATLKITGSSAVILEDAQVTPPLKLRLDLAEAVLRDIDSSQPGKDSGLVLKSGIGEHSRIEIEGTVQPFAERITMSLKSHIEGLEVLPLSPFAADAIGYRLQSGHLDADSNIRIDKGRMDIGNKLILRGLDVVPVTGESLERLESRSSVPLKTALNMLRDKHNTIRLDLPVSGDISSPDFDISDAINQAVGKAMKKGATSYLTMALQPYGTLITVARLAGEAAAKVRLEPVRFAPASAALDETALDYLGKVAGILKDRPEVNIKLCGVAVESDRSALQALVSAGGAAASGQVTAQAAAVGDERLLELARQRDVVMKNYLVSEHSIKATRLVACQPAIDSDATGLARVDMLI